MGEPYSSATSTYAHAVAAWPSTGAVVVYLRCGHAWLGRWSPGEDCGQGGWCICGEVRLAGGTAGGG